MNHKRITIFLFSISMCCAICFFASCNSARNDLVVIQTKTNSLTENILVIGKDTLKLKKIDSMVCGVVHHHDNTGRFKGSKIPMFEAPRTETIDIHGYANYYDPFFNDCYDDCECNFLDTTADHKISFIAISKHFEASPEELIRSLENKFEFLSPSESYSISTLRFSAFCPDGKCQWHWSNGHPESSFDNELKSDLRKNFKKGTYLILKTIVAINDKGNYVLIHPNLCWHYK